MSQYISNEWFRTVHKKTNHHAALLDRPSKVKPLDYKNLLPIFHEDDEISYYYTLLRFLLNQFMDAWKTPPSATFNQTRYHHQRYKAERKIIASVWALAGAIDSLEENEAVNLDSRLSAETYLEHLREFWTRDTSIYSREKRDPFREVWSFVAGCCFPEPPPKFKLASLVAAVKEKKRDERPLVTSNETAVGTESRDIFDDLFPEINKSFAKVKLGDDDASEAVRALETLLENTPILEQDPFCSVYDSIKRRNQDLPNPFRTDGEAGTQRAGFDKSDACPSKERKGNVEVESKPQPQSDILGTGGKPQGVYGTPTCLTN